MTDRHTVPLLAVSMLAGMLMLLLMSDPAAGATDRDYGGLDTRSSCWR